MFYFIVSRLPIISGITDGSKFYKILIIGSICYVILHAILFSNIGDNIDLIRIYRSYMYYLWGIDGVLTAGYLKFLAPVPKQLEDNSDETNEEKKPDGLTREQILQKLKEQDKKPSSPFIKREELNNQPQNQPQNQTTSVTSGQTTLHQNSPAPKKVSHQQTQNDEQEIADMSDTDIPSYKPEKKDN